MAHHRHARAARGGVVTVVARANHDAHGPLVDAVPIFTIVPYLRRGLALDLGDDSLDDDEPARKPWAWLTPSSSGSARFANAAVSA